MSERWREPVIPIAIERGTRLVMRKSGVALPMEMPELVLQPRDVARLANGRVCIHCLEPLEHAYPERCPVCGYAVRKQQAIDFNAQFGGEETPLTPMDDHIARFNEDDARAIHQPGKQILVSRSVKRSET